MGRGLGMFSHSSLKSNSKRDRRAHQSRKTKAFKSRFRPQCSIRAMSSIASK